MFSLNKYFSEAFHDEVQSKYCSNPCTTLTTTYGLPFIGKRSNVTRDAFVKLYLIPTIKVRRSVPAYDLVQLIAEFGGYLGLCLGFSLLDLYKLCKMVL